MKISKLLLSAVALWRLPETTRTSLKASSMPVSADRTETVR